MQLFFHSELGSDMIQLSRDEAMHAIKSLRMRQGDAISITDGRGTLARGEIIVADPSACSVRITERDISERRANCNLHIAVAPTKNADRIEWFVEKSVEIGIDEITPLITHNTERTRINYDRLCKIAVSAMKQSLHTHLPTIHSASRYADFIGRDFDAIKMICHGHYDNPQTLPQAYQPQHNAVVVIGPEGDFTPDEIRLADTHGFRPVSLGVSRLRTETAALFAVSAINLINQ